MHLKDFLFALANFVILFGALFLITRKGIARMFRERKEKIARALEEAKQAEQAGASWVIVGHLFATACNPGLPPRGLSFLQEIKQAVSIPVYGIGGIHVQNAAQVQAIGADGICMMSDWMQAEEPEQLMQQLRAIKPEEQR